MPRTKTNFPSVPVFQPSTDTVGPSGPEPEYQPMNDDSASVRPGDPGRLARRRHERRRLPGDAFLGHLSKAEERLHLVPDRDGDHEARRAAGSAATSQNRHRARRCSRSRATRA